MCGKILVPIDFSSLTRTVVSWAASLARDRKASLLLLHVQEPAAQNIGGEMYFPMPIEEDPALRQSLRDIVPEDVSIAHEHRLVLGTASDEILHVAKDEKVDMIVIGSHGRGWLGRLLLGSVAEHVMRHASCPVLIVKEHAAPAVPSPAPVAATARAATA